MRRSVLVLHRRRLGGASPSPLSTSITASTTGSTTTTSSSSSLSSSATASAVRCLSMAPAGRTVDNSAKYPPLDAASPHFNPGTELDLAWLADVRCNKSAIERRAAEIGGRRSVKKAWQAAWLLRATTMIDLTTLSGDDTPGNVSRLCAKARNPIMRETLEALGCSELPITTGAVCVYPKQVAHAVKCLEGSGIPVASVATGFPAGQIMTSHKLAEIRQCVADGAAEIDIVISRDLVLTGDWQGVYDEVKAFKEACGPARMKTILATGELATYRNVYQASLACMMAGADFIKTSTGKEKTNATLEVSLVMMRALREFFHETGYRVGYKPAGGISTGKQSLTYLSLVKDELGDDWLTNEKFRFGASSLLNDIERQLHHQATGSYAAGYYMPMA